MEKHSSQWADFRGIFYLWIFTSSVKEIQFWLNLTDTTDTRLMKIYDISPFSSWVENSFQNIVQKSQTLFFKHILPSILHQRHVSVSLTVSSKAFQVALVRLV